MTNSREALVKAAGASVRERARLFPGLRARRAEKRVEGILNGFDKVRQSSQSPEVRRLWKGMSQRASRSGAESIAAYLDNLSGPNWTSEDHYEAYVSVLDPKSDRDFPNRAAAAAQAIALVVVGAESRVTVPLSNPLRATETAVDLDTPSPEQNIRALYNILPLREIIPFSQYPPTDQDLVHAPMRLIVPGEPDKNIQIKFSTPQGQRRKLPEGYTGIPHATMTVTQVFEEDSSFSEPNANTMNYPGDHEWHGGF